MSRILVIEDDELSLRLVRDILRYRGHEVLEATTVSEGRTQLQRATPDIVLMDVRLPGGGGEVLLREIRSEPRLAGLPVVAVTAQAMRGDRERLLEAGFDGYISKPISVKAFGPEVESFVKTGGSDERPGKPRGTGKNI